MKWLFLMLVAFYGCNNGTPNHTVENPAQTISIREDSLTRFVLVTQKIPLPEAKRQLTSLIKHAETDSLNFRKIFTFLSKPFSDPNSPYRNEDLYIQLLNAQLKSRWFIDQEKIAAQNKLKLAMQNRVGAAANDFTYFTPGNVRRTLYEISAPFTLIYFYNPECHACMEMKETILSSNILTKNIASARVKFLAMYTDPDEALWRKHLPENPKAWLNGRDSGEYLWNNRVYDLRAIPTIYLLDKNKTVLLRDATITQLESVLQ